MYKTERSNRTVLPRLIELLDVHLETVDGRIAELHALRDEIRNYREHVATRLLEADR
jgi:MerR family transcriptional regulator, repressor of the yfmOP operon